MLAECRSRANFIAAGRDAWPEIENSLVVAGAAALIACLSGVITSGWPDERRNAIANWFAILPLAVPPLVLGLAWLRATQRIEPVELAWLGDSFWLVILALASRAWPLAMLVLIVGQRRLPYVEREAARLSGLSSLRRLWWIEWPRIREYAAAAMVGAFVISAGDVEISQLLCPPGGGTLALRLFTFLHFGPAHVAASLALVQLIVCLLPVVVYLLWTDRWRQVV
jgi:ABC-type Fe3+ transport system permease subunit